MKTGNWDVTTKISASEEARETAERLRLALEAGHLGSYRLDIASGHMDCSALCLANFGLPPDADFPYAALLEMIHPEDRPRMQAAVEHALREHGDYEAEYRIVLPNGETRWIAARGQAIYNADGEPTQMIGVTQNVTERQRNQEMLRDSEQRFRALTDNIAQLAWMADGSGAVFWYNRRWFEYTGTTLDEVKGWGWRKLHHPDFVEPVEEKFRTHLETGEPWEDTFPLMGADGQYRWFLSRAFPIRDDAGNVSLWCGTNTDITGQRQAEEALRASETAVQERERRIRALYALTSRADLGFAEKVNHLLHMGREWLGLETALSSRMYAAAGKYEVTQVDSDEESFPAGFTCPLELTYCSTFLKTGPYSAPIAVQHAGADPTWFEHPAYKEFKCEAYLGAVIRVGEDVWGTLVFVSGKPRREPFSEFDKDMVRLTAQWIGGEIARQEAEAALQMSALKQRRFVREMLSSVTEGKLRLGDSPDDLPEPLPPASDPIELTPSRLRVLRKQVEAVAEGLSLPDERVQDLLTAVGEAGMNAVKHGGGVGTGRVHADPERGLIQVWISDQGTGIREEDIHRATLEKGWSGSGSLGHGFFLMLRTVDHTYLLTGAQGTTVVLEQARKAPPPEWLTSVTL